jgi:hypothetical protein
LQENTRWKRKVRKLKEEGKKRSKRGRKDRKLKEEGKKRSKRGRKDRNTSVA